MLSLFFGLCASATAVAAGREDAFCLFRDGKPMAAIVLPAGVDATPRNRQCDVQLVAIPGDVPSDLMRAVGEFRRDLREGYGIELPVVFEPGPGSAPDDGVQPLPNRIELVVEERTLLDEDRTLVSFPAPEVLRITGGESGVIRTLFHLLEAFGGARYLFQGAAEDIGIGAHFPALAALEIPRKAFTRSSDFPLDRRSSQTTSGAHWPGERNRTYHWNWEARLGAKQRVTTGHDLSRIAFPVAAYAEAENKPSEEMFPIHQGQRVLPWEQGYRQAYWQPRFSSPAAVDEAVKNLLAHLRENPGVRSLSLVVNDSGGHCETERDNPGGHYYRWVNAVVARVAAEFPQVLFGVAPYREVAEAPGFQLHANVVSVMTFDLHPCLDPEVRQRRVQLVRDWAAVCRQIGHYAYNTGDTAYSLPRLYMREMQDMLQVLHEQGAVASFTERSYTTVAEGPKMYVFLKLLEDPYLDLEATIQDWCDAAVGQAAGRVLREYYAFWEDFWRTKAIHTSWWKSSKNSIYLSLGQFGSYLYALERGDMARCRARMEQVVALADAQGDAVQRKRARLLLQIFEWHEANAVASGGEYFAAEGRLPDRAAALDLLRAIPAAQAAYETSRTLPEQIGCWLAPKVTTGRMTAADPVVNSIAAVSDFFEDPAVIAALRALADDPRIDGRLRFLADAMVRSATGDDADNLVDGDFSDEAHGWLTSHSSHGSVSRSDDVVLRGTHALKCTIEHPNYTIEKIVTGVTPFTQHYFSARVFVPAGQPVAEGVLNIRGSPIQRIGDRYHNRGHPRNITDVVLVPGQWTYVSCILPAHATLPTDALRLVFRFRSFEQGNVAYIDDVRVVPVRGVLEE